MTPARDPKQVGISFKVTGPWAQPLQVKALFWEYLGYQILVTRSWLPDFDIMSRQDARGSTMYVRGDEMVRRGSKEGTGGGAVVCLAAPVYS